MASVYTILSDTLTGTPGTTLVGHVPAPIQCASGVWEHGIDADDLVFATGGGATSAGSAANWSSGYAVSGLTAGIGTYTFSGKLISSGSVAPTWYFRSDNGGGLANQLSLQFNTSDDTFQLFVVDATLGLVTNSSVSSPLTVGVTVNVVVTITSTTISATVNGSPAFTNVTIPTASGSRIYFRQQAGTGGQFVFGPMLIAVPGPNTATVTGPTALVDGVASGNYTITLSSAVPAGGAGIIFTPSATAFTAVATPTTRTIAPGATTGTFIETASTTGTGTVTVAATAGVTGLTIVPQTGVVASGSSPATAFTVTGPTSGSVNTLSSNFIVTPLGTFTGTITIALSGGGLSGTIVKTFTGPPTPQNFGITPTALGTVTLTATNSGSLTGPSPLTYTVVAVSTHNQLEMAYPTPSSAPIYFAIVQAGKAWNGSAMESLNSSNWGTYDIPGADTAGVGIYLADFPASVPVGVYTAYAYLQVGGSPASTDTRIGSETGSWDGTTFGSGGGSGGGATPTEVTAIVAAALAPFNLKQFLATTSTSCTLAASDAADAARASTAGTDQFVTIGTGLGVFQTRQLGAKTSTQTYAVEAWDVTPDTTTSGYWLHGADATTTGGGSGGSDLNLKTGTVLGSPTPTTTRFRATIADFVDRGAASMRALFQGGSLDGVGRRVATCVSISGDIYELTLEFDANNLLPAAPAAGQSFKIG